MLILANGIFAGAELALLSVRKTRLSELLEEGNSAAQSVKALRENPERFLATVQIGITVVGASAAAFGGASIAQRLVGPLTELGLKAETAESLAFAGVVGGVSYLSLVLGELV
ncbi:MAG TPA: CNNM domain-containing protein, partial [Archangium sp.]|nr:CNNM domain-containing protein [Archangium sp.]